MTDKVRAARPAEPEFKYYLAVDDSHNPDDGICKYPREGYAALSYWDRETHYISVSEYIQEQAFADPSHPTEDEIHGTVMPYKGAVGRYDGWETGPGPGWDFIETVRDTYYEYGIDPSTLPVRVLTNRVDADENDASNDELYEIYFRNGENTVEYLMWNSNELYLGREDDTYMNSELIQKIIAAFARAYEEPDAFLAKWGDRGVNCAQEHN